MSVKAWKHSDPAHPSFPADFEVPKKAVLQVTDIKNNNNKYYAIELHTAVEKGKQRYRVFTHYGRTDDLETNPDAGMKESRFFTDLGEAQREYDKIYRAKTGPSKGYKEVALASSRIGSANSRGKSSGEVDAKTLEKMKGGEEKPAVQASTLPAAVQGLISYIYEEATEALTSTVAAKITAHGIETPLGILTVGQIEKGERILNDLYTAFKAGKASKRMMEEASGEFYSAIPHRLGRTRDAISAAVIDSIEDFNSKQETLQLMKDMLAVNGEQGSVLFDAQVDQKYKALGCEISALDSGSSGFKEMADYVINSQVKSKRVKIKSIYTLKRNAELEVFQEKIGNERLLFHGSRIKNWVGILSRGILMPKIVVSMGVNRTDAGWLGNGMYFGDAACTSAFYTTPGRKQTRFMSIARVALGKMKDYTKITYGLNAPPAGYDSTHGVRRKPGVASEFDDDEYVIYDPRQQRLEYLIEFTI